MPLKERLNLSGSLGFHPPLQCPGADFVSVIFTDCKNMVHGARYKVQCKRCKEAENMIKVLRTLIGKHGAFGHKEREGWRELLPVDARFLQ